MSSFTYDDLIAHLATLTPHQRKMEVILYNTNDGELTLIDGYAITGQEPAFDRKPELDEIVFNHPYLMAFVVNS